MGAKYTATAYLRVQMAEDQYLNDINQRPVTEYEYDTFKNTQMQYIQSRFVLIAALRKREVSQLPIIQEQVDAPDWLSKKLAISYPGKGEIMQVSMTTPDKKQSMEIVNSVVDAYFKEVIYAQMDKKRSKLNAITKYYDEKKGEVSDRTTNFLQLTEDLGTAESENLNLKQRLILEELNAYRGELMRSQFEVNRLESEEASQRAILANLSKAEVSEIDVQQIAQVDPFLRRLSEEVAWQQMQYESTLGTIKDNTRSPFADRYMGDANRMKKQYDDRMMQIKENIKKKREAEVRKEIDKLAGAIDRIKDRQDDLAKIVDERKEEVRKFGKASVELAMQKSDLEVIKKTLQDLAVSKDRLDIELKQTNRVVVLKQADEPQMESGRPIRIALSAFSGMVGFFLPFVSVVLIDVRHRRVNNPRDIVEQLGLSVIGSVPRIPIKALHNFGTSNRKHQIWQLRLTESIDGIAARLLRRGELEQRRVLMVSSADSGEGKTTLAAQLAMSLARAGRRTLLIDFDLRQPTLDQAFGIAAVPGVSEILRGENDLASALHATPTPNFFVLTAGQWDRTALSALSNNVIGGMMKELRDEFEFVIIDSSPILPVADSRYVSQYVDSVVLCVFRDRSEMTRLRSACEILEAFGVRGVDVVVTGSNENLYGNRSGIEMPTMLAADE